jgi:hypothetical protein
LKTVALRDGGDSDGAEAVYILLADLQVAVGERIAYHRHLYDSGNAFDDVFQGLTGSREELGAPALDTTVFVWRKAESRERRCFSECVAMNQYRREEDSLVLDRREVGVKVNPVLALPDRG